jgi:hypothetical protein
MGCSDRLPLVLLAQVAASVQARFGEHHGWRHSATGLLAYLRFLATCGYGLSEVEEETADTGEGSIERLVLPGNNPGSAGLLRFATQFRTAHAASTLTCRRRKERCPNSDNPQYSNSSHSPAHLLPRFPSSSLARSHPSQPPISHISLLHTCGIRGGSGLDRGG